VGLSLYSFILARQRIEKHIPAKMKNCWRYRFLCSPYHIKGKQAILTRTSCLYVSGWGNNSDGCLQKRRLNAVKINYFH
jgi:hypothetical protein